MHYFKAAAALGRKRHLIHRHQSPLVFEIVARFCIDQLIKRLGETYMIKIKALIVAALIFGTPSAVLAKDWSNKKKSFLFGLVFC